MQSRRLSLIEANVNTWTGLAGSWSITYYCMPLLDHYGAFWYSNIVVGLCTVWSLLRGYYIRRFFNWVSATVQ